MCFHTANNFRACIVQTGTGAVGRHSRHALHHTMSRPTVAACITWRKSKSTEHRSPTSPPSLKCKHKSRGCNRADKVCSCKTLGNSRCPSSKPATLGNSRCPSIELATLGNNRCPSIELATPGNSRCPNIELATLGNSSSYYENRTSKSTVTHQNQSNTKHTKRIPVSVGHVLMSMHAHANLSCAWARHNLSINT